MNISRYQNRLSERLIGQRVHKSQRQFVFSGALVLIDNASFHFKFRCSLNCPIAGYTGQFTYKIIGLSSLSLSFGFHLAINARHKATYFTMPVDVTTPIVYDCLLVLNCHGRYGDILHARPNNMHHAHVDSSIVLTVHCASLQVLSSSCSESSVPETLSPPPVMPLVPS